MSESWLVILVAAILLAGFHLVLRPLAFSPLRTIPCAHWSAPVSSFWILRARKSGWENSLLLKAHCRCGPVLRIAPDALSIDGPDAVRTVYQGGFDKDPWYAVFDNYGVPCMFSARSSPEHSARKRMIANVYSKSHIQSSASAKAQAKAMIFDRLLPSLNRPLYACDVHSLFLATTMDFISAYVYGLADSTNFIQDRNYRKHWLRLYNSRNDHHFWPQEMPRVTAFFQRLGLWLYPSQVDDANAELSDWNWNICRNALARWSEKGPRRDSADEPIVLDALNTGIDKEDSSHGCDSLLYPTVAQHRDLSVASELFDHVLAGQETAGVVLTYASWHLSRRPSLQDQIRRELLALEPNMKTAVDKTGQLPDSKQLDALPLLHAIIMETLRLHAPIPGPQPRRTPYPSCMIGGHEVPGGVRVAALAHTLHRDERVFSNPERWDHGRWLPSASTDHERRERHRNFWAFGSGGRMCIGSNFAMSGKSVLSHEEAAANIACLEMKLVVAAIYTNFTTYVVDDYGIHQTDMYTARPASERLILRFEPVRPKHAFGIDRRLNVPPLTI